MCACGHIPLRFVVCPRLRLIKHVESYRKDWIGPLRSDRQVTYADKEMRVDALDSAPENLLRSSIQDIVIK
jgi:hypothetical protein